MILSIILLVAGGVLAYLPIHAFNSPLYWKRTAIAYAILFWPIAVLLVYVSLSYWYPNL